MPDTRELDGRLLIAVQHGNAELARSLLNSGANPQAVDFKGRLGTHIAVARDDYSYGTGRELVAMFLNRGVDINARDREGATVLHLGAQDESYSASAKVNDFVSFGGDVQARDNNGRTPLHYAAIKGYKTDAITALLEHHADVNAADEQGVTPLHLAAARGAADVIHAFLKAGADIDARTKDGRTVWDYAIEGGKDYQAQVLKAESARRAAEAEKQRVRQAQPQKPADPWTLLGPDRVAHTTIERGVGYKLTEIFNFSARTYTQVTHNLNTKSEAVAVKTFDEFHDKTPIEKAHAALERLGGTASGGLISGPILEKPKRSLKLPGTP